MSDNLRTRDGRFMPISYVKYIHLFFTIGIGLCRDPRSNVRHLGWGVELNSIVLFSTGLV